MATVPTLKLVCESKLCDLMPCDPPTKRWEASGVLVKDGHYFVVFDDRTEIARVSDDLQPNSTNGLFGMAHAVCGYEGITYNAAKRRYYLLVESRRAGGRSLPGLDRRVRRRIPISQGTAGRLHLQE